VTGLATARRSSWVPAGALTSKVKYPLPEIIRSPHWQISQLNLSAAVETIARSVSRDQIIVASQEVVH
jgi:hypothetical protein